MSAKGKSKAANYRDPLILLACVIIGGALGIIFGEKASIIKPIGQIFINLLFCLVVPLVFFSISSSIASVGGCKTGRKTFRLYNGSICFDSGHRRHIDDDIDLCASVCDRNYFGFR